MEASQRLDALLEAGATGEVRFQVEAIEDGLTKSAEHPRVVEAKRNGMAFCGYVGGWASLPSEDRLGERVVQEGLDLKWLLQDGWWSDNHLPDNVAPRLGFPVVAELRDHPDPSMGKCLWVEGPVLDTPRGRDIMRQVRTLKGTGRQYGFSIESPEKPQRDPLDPKRITRARLWNVAITDRPMHPHTRIVLVKSASLSTATVDALLRFAEQEPEHARAIWGLHKALLATVPDVSPSEGVAALQTESVGPTAPTVRTKHKRKRGLTLEQAAEYLASHPVVKSLGLTKDAIKAELAAFCRAE
jgi:hypothetical protein